MPLVVIEGCDGAGGETQSGILIKKLKRMNIPYKLFRYPKEGEPIGKLIHDFLHGGYEFNEKILFLLYSAEMIQDQPEIKKALEIGEMVICDRYFTTTLAYEGVLGFELRKGLQYAKLFEIQEPDLVFYLKIKPETSLTRKAKEKGLDTDRFEENLDFQKKIGKTYDEFAKDNVFSKKWIVLDGEREIKEVAEEIEAALRKEGFI